MYCVKKLGYVKNKQSDWFRASTAKLTPLLERKNNLYNLWLNTGKERDRHKFAVLYRSMLRRSGLYIKQKKQREGDTVVKYCGDV